MNGEYGGAAVGAFKSPGDFVLVVIREVKSLNITPLNAACGCLLCLIVGL